MTMRSLAAWNVWRERNTSLMARATSTSPAALVASMMSGWTMEGWASSSRASRSCSRKSFIRKPTEPRFMP